MNAASTSVEGGTAGPIARKRLRRRRRWVVAGVVVVAVGGTAAGVAVTRPFGATARPAGVTDNGAPTSLVTVRKGTLISQTQVNGTLGFAGNLNVFNPASGVFTRLPRPGQVISQGQPLYWVSGDPVVFLIGRQPLYRDLSEGMTGPDVRQLNAALVALGYGADYSLDKTSDYFSWQTHNALELLQKHLGVTETGELTTSQAVFLPLRAARVVAVNASVGQAATSGATALRVTSTARRVSVALNAAEESYVKVGDKVTITLPNNHTTPGVVTSVGTVAQGKSTSATISVSIRPLKPSATGSLDQAPVEVSIVTQRVRSATTVPVDALVALDGGGYAVEVVGPGGTHRLVAVTLGVFDDAAGTVQVTGSGLAVGQRIVVPGS